MKVTRLILIVCFGLGGCAWTMPDNTQRKVASDGRPCVNVGYAEWFMPVYAMPDNHSKVCQ